MNKLSRKIVKSILLKPCPSGIPRSGEGGKKINCYTLSLYEGDSSKLLIDSITEKGFEGKYWIKNKFESEVVFPFKLMRGLDLHIDHYHGLMTHKYIGIAAYILHEWTCFYKVKSFYYLSKQNVPQFLFDRKELELPQRMEILEKLISRQANEPRRAITLLDMMTYMYSIRWHLHPRKNEFHGRLRLYLESFVASGELRRANGGDEYFITGRAISSLEGYQIETKRAKDSKSSRKLMIWLTAVLAFFAAFQSGLFKSPVWVDFDRLWNYIQSYM